MSGTRWGVWGVALCAVVYGMVRPVEAALLTDPDDPRTWQGASVETFRDAFGFPTKADLIDAHILDDGIFIDPAGLTFGSYIGPVVGADGFSYLPSTYAYTIPSGLGYAGAANARDYRWVQDTGDNGVLSANIWDLGGEANQVAVFPIIDHGPLPQEALEYTVFLSDDPSTSLGWTQALIDKVYLEGWDASGIADGFTTVWRLPEKKTFRFTSVTALGPGALRPYYGDDDEIDTVAGLTFEGGSVGGSVVPEPASMLLFGMGLVGAGVSRRKRLLS